MTGTVRFYVPARSFGFITPDDGGPEVYVGRTPLSLRAGDLVSFATEPTAKGWRALNVRLLTTASHSQEEP